MPYCFLSHIPRLARHLTVGDSRLRLKIVEQQRSKYPYCVNRFEENQNLSLQLLGDTGEGDRSQYILVDLLERMPQFFPDSQFAVILGDIVYPDGGKNNREYEQRFFIPYRNYPLPIYGMTGNHDWYGKLRGFLEHFVDRQHLSSGAIPSQRSLSEIYGRPPVNLPNIYYYIETANARIICLDTGKTGKHIDDEQFDWLSDVSQTSKRKILLLHHPLYSNGKRQKIADQLESLIVDRQIPLVIAAHVHNYQKYTVTDPLSGHTTIHLVNGAGGAGLSPTHQLADSPTCRPDDFYPSAEQSNEKFGKILGLLRPPAELTNCHDDFPYYKSFINVSIQGDDFNVTVFKKEGYPQDHETSEFVV